MISAIKKTKQCQHRECQGWKITSAHFSFKPLIVRNTFRTVSEALLVIVNF